MIWPYCLGSLMLASWFMVFALCKAAARGDRMWERARQEMEAEDG